MKKHPPLAKTFLITFITLAIFTGQISWAQTSIVAKALSATFLVEFAQKLFERGEYDAAQNVLKSILKIDPENPPVKQLLSTVEEQLYSSDSIEGNDSRPSDIASDIMFIQKNVLVFERQNRDLEFAIRKILQENMFLYQTLSRRNQDLLSLRKKFFGINDAEESDGTSDRERTITDSLDAFQEEITKRDEELTVRNQEIARKMKEVGKAGESLKDQDLLSTDMDSAANVLEWKDDLTEKRAVLVEKAITLLEKNRDLTLLLAQLTDVSRSLKEANNDYGDAVSEYEAKIEQLNNVWVQDKAREQSEIDQLRKKIKNEKVKVYASKLSSSASNQSDSIDETTEKSTGRSKGDQPGRPGFSESTSEFEGGLNEALAEIRRLETELARKEKELSDRSRIFDAKIRELKSGWATDKQALQGSIRSKSSFVPAENDPFKDSETYRELIQELEYLRDQVSLNEKSLNRFQNELLDQTAQVEALQQKLVQRDTRLAEMNEIIVAKDEQIKTLKSELVSKIEEVRIKDAEIKSLKARAGSLDGINDMSKRVVQIKTPAPVAGSESVEKLKGLVSELEGSLVPDAPASNEVNDLKEQLQESLRTLQEKDREIQSLRDQMRDDKKLSALNASSADKKSDDAKIEKYEQVINDLKERLAQSVDQRQDAYDALQKATARLSTMVDEDSSRDSGKVLDMSSVERNEFKQKIDELNRQIAQQSSDFDLRMKEMTQQLAEKDGQIAELKARLSAKEKEIQQFYSSMEKATEKLNAAATGRGAGRSSEGKIQVVPQGVSRDQDWDPSDNNIYSLQQRLKTLSNELRFAQDELIERTKEKSELQGRVKQQGSARPFSKDDILKLEKELATFRQQSDLTRTTIRLQQESLQKSQKEVDRKERSLKSILDQSDKLRKQIEEYKFTIEEKDEQIELQQKALDHEIKKNDTLTKKLREIQKTAAYDQKRGAGTSQSMGELIDSIKSYEIRERDYKRQISDIQGQLKSSYVMIEDGEKRVETLKKRLAVREKRIAELQSEIDQFKAAFDKAQEQ